MELTSDTIALMMLLVNVSTKSQCLIRVVLGQYSLVQMEIENVVNISIEQ